MREIPRAPSRSTIAQIGQLSRRAERAIQFVHGSRLSRSIAGINDIPYLPNKLLKHIDNDLRFAISRSITPSWLTTRIAKDIASRVPYTHRGLSDTSALALASKVAMLDNILAKNMVVPSYRDFSIPALIRLEEYQSTSPYILNQYKPLNQSSTKPRDTDLIDDILMELLEDHGFEYALYHFRESVGVFRSGYYAASNSQIRTFLEGFIKELYSRVTDQKATNVHGSLDHLKAKGFLTRDEYNSLKALWLLSNTRGSHPGYASQKGSLGRILMATDIAEHLIAKI